MMYQPTQQDREYLRRNTARQNEKIEYYFNCIASYEERIEDLINSNEKGLIWGKPFEDRLKYFNQSIAKYLRRVAECEEQKEINAQILAR